MLVASQESVANAGLAFREHWYAYAQRHKDRNLDAAHLRALGAAPGGCIFAAATAHRLFGGEVEGNWHHVWLRVEGALVDLTGLADLPPTDAIRLHVAMLADRGYHVEARPDGGHAVTLPWRDSFIQYPTILPAALLSPDRAHLRSREFRDVYASVLPRSHAWARNISEREVARDRGERDLDL